MIEAIHAEQDRRDGRESQEPLARFALISSVEIMPLTPEAIESTQ